MTPTRLRLKNPTGWFAAGQEVALALEILSAEAFKLYFYLCLHAERQTGRIHWDRNDAAHLFDGGDEKARSVMEELCRQQVCTLSGANAVEIVDRFWPYEKPTQVEPGQDLAGYVRQVRQILLRPACVRASFSGADELLAANFHRRGVTLAQLDRAIWLGCARKYVALLNGQTPMLITSLHYFTGLVEEVAATTVPDSYWLHVRRKVEQLERRWIASRNSTSAGKQDEMMETK
jgi:hypothetical protein